ncbi:uncharacterized protein TRIVIDRAFT_46933 [Trichoderma virens Gv29-8]|uniref:NAD(P)-binding protein n=1 Tax=Hypocrea virens (strain Gv29-8 / FGSC 10586) TaxID=413071 RepID=G9N066_HYPVG|nr:uncharacterized protein TRIVIDRAFT_46933 [Trichoderma virens Gv29-8]EHK19748.1 hypothetical protein TRIVIDRAFT_46933 [Trichoderma virens Gv29-8]UKZ53141.1 hypothetical protein TrVGV298_006932 [Trichoderma virens]
MSLSEDHFTTTGQFTKKVYRDVYPDIDPTSASLSQEGKIVIITGASRGIGKLSLATAFAKANAKAIVLSARNVADLQSTEELIHEINPRIEVLSAKLEITDEESVKSFFDQIKAKFGTADVLVNNAGLFQSEGQFVQSGLLETWWHDIEVNVKGQMLVAKYFLQLLGSEKEGMLIGLSSAAAFMVAPGASAYSLAKLADLQLTRYISVENPNVTAISFHPGIILTDMHDDARGFRHFAKDTPELAGGVAVWLCTKTAAFLNGRYMAVNWAVDELLAKKEEIIAGDLLKIQLGGEFGDAVIHYM